MPSSPHEFFKVFLLSSDYRPSVDRPSTECWPITDRYISEALTNYRWSVGEVSVNEKLYRPRYIWNDYWPCLDRVLSDYHPSLVRLLTAILTESRLTIDRLSTECRPLFRPIDRSTLPTVNRIRSVIHTVGTIQSNLPAISKEDRMPFDLPFPFTLPQLFRSPAISNFFSFPLGLRNSGVRLYYLKFVLRFNQYST